MPLGKVAASGKLGAMEPRLSLESIKQHLPEGGLFGGGSWRWSPVPIGLTRGEARRITTMGHPLARFQKTCDTLYRRSAAGSMDGWLAELLDEGKPSWLCDLQCEQGTADLLPRVIRPDLIITENGFALTELDSVPGGIGVTAWLSRIYAEAGFEILGGSDGMLEGFKSILPRGGKVLVSDEAADYRPEMEWLCEQLGAEWTVQAAEQYQPGDGSDLYRFFENFDWEAIPEARHLAEAAAEGKVNITPPFKPHLEDKLWLALLWSPALQRVWGESLRGNHLKRIQELVPFGWVLDPTPLPPHAALPHLDAHSWDEVARFSQKQRQLVLKISGFHETAWGSRGVFIGHDMPQKEWADQIEYALDQANEQPWIMQEFREGKIVEHPVYREDGTIELIKGRVRLCPYYFTDDDGQTKFAGCLATMVPADKKKIHGMSDGVLMPCVVEKAHNPS